MDGADGGDGAGGSREAAAAAAAAVDDMEAVVDAMERALGADDPTTASTRRLLTQWKQARTDTTPRAEG